MFKKGLYVEFKINLKVKSENVEKKNVKPCELREKSFRRFVRKLRQKNKVDKTYLIIYKWEMISIK